MNKKNINIFEKLNFKSIRKVILSWGKANYKNFPWRNTNNKWHALLAEILLQRTKVRAVVPVYEELIKKYPKPTDLANAPLPEIKKIVYSLGLPARAEVLKRLGSEVALIKGKIPLNSDELIKLPGIGSYVAAAWLSFHANKKDELFEKYSEQFKKAESIAWKATLGETPHPEVTEKINKALKKSEFWVLIGGPPCQAYSLVGRSVMMNKDRNKYETDPRHELYKEYVQIIADHCPPVFIMENVKGLLSSTLKGNKVFELILSDLSNPVAAANSYGKTEIKAGDEILYDIYPLTRKTNLFATEPRDYLIECEGCFLKINLHSD